MIEQLFGSKTRVKLLQLFYGNPNRPFFVREITRKIDEQINSVRRELSNLQNIGIISSDNSDNKLYYEVNQQFKYYKPLAVMFGDASLLKKNSPLKSDDEYDLKKLGRVDLLLLTGQFTRDESSGIDILIVGDLNTSQINKYIDYLEKQENKQLRFVVMDSKEFTYRQTVNDRFLLGVLNSKKQIIADRKYWVSTKQETSAKENKIKE